MSSTCPNACAVQLAAGPEDGVNRKYQVATGKWDISVSNEFDGRVWKNRSTVVVSESNRVVFIQTSEGEDDCVWMRIGIFEMYNCFDDIRIEWNLSKLDRIVFELISSNNCFDISFKSNKKLVQILVSFVIKGKIVRVNQIRFEITIIRTIVSIIRLCHLVKRRNVSNSSKKKHLV